MPWRRGEDYQASVEIKPAHLASYFLEHRNPKTSKKELCLSKGPEEVLWGLARWAKLGFSILKV